MNLIKDLDIYNTSNDKSLLKSLGPYRIHTTFPLFTNQYTVVGTPVTVPDVVIGELVWDSENVFDENDPKLDDERKEELGQQTNVVLRHPSGT